MIARDALIKLFQQMQKEHWHYEWGEAREGCVDCSGAFVYAYQALDDLKIKIHGSNYIARKECASMLPVSKAKPGMAAFKRRLPGSGSYALPGRYQKGGMYYNGDLNDYYHIGLVDTDAGYVLNAQSAKTGFVRSPISQNWCAVADLLRVNDEGSVEPMEVLYTAIVGNLAENTDKLNVREAPSASAKKLGTLSKGEQVEVYEEADGWAKIAQGYAKSCFLIKQEEDGISEKLDGITKLLEAIWAKMNAQEVQGV